MSLVKTGSIDERKADGYFQMSGKKIAALALLNSCPRCFWVQAHAGEMPYTHPAGIFSSIDSYTKKMVHRYIDLYGRAPKWLEDILGEKIVKYVDDSFHWLHYNACSETDKIILTGSPDDILVTESGNMIMVDYKTAREAKDELFPLYEYQINSYANIAETLEMCSPVHSLWIIYFEPQTEEADENNVTLDGFNMPFNMKAHQVVRNVAIVDSLLTVARSIYDSPQVPQGVNKCKDCKKLDRLLAIF